MFSSRRFKHIPCPQQDECQLPQCFFSHEKPVDALMQDAPPVYDPLSAGMISLPPAKRRRLDTDSARLSEYDTNSRATSRTATPDIPKLPSPASKPPKLPPSSNSQSTNGQANRLVALESRKQATPVSTMPVTTHRPVSPPPLKQKQILPPARSFPPFKAEKLNPRPVPRAPATYGSRESWLKLLHSQLQAQNKKLLDGDHKWKALHLRDHELVKLALDGEEEYARKYQGDVYRNEIPRFVQRVKKMSEEQWRSFVVEKVAGKSSANSRPDSITSAKRPSTGLSSLLEEVEVISKLRTSLVGLEQYGYVAKQPSDDEIAIARGAVEASAGWEKCDRCGTRFQIFPGRDNDGKLTSGGQCRCHWAKSRYAAPQKTDRTALKASATYPCCQQSIGTEGCTEAETHVFKVDDKKRLASILQFEHTPANQSPSPTPVSFDCEMAYTTFGMEVIRVTAVTWPDGKDLLDILVRPYGEILDFNTRFSGVNAKQFAEAIPYVDVQEQDETTTETEHNPKPLRKVESPAAARQLLFNLLSPETPLIGHAIDNDLNVVRIIHPLVIDTVLLYPHPKGLPMRLGLRQLVSTHLDRSIQSAGEVGHDSKEDAIATGDLVTLAVANKWRKLKLTGWIIENGKLVMPQAPSKPVASKSTL